jgi:hypothetical protein
MKTILDKNSDFDITVEDTTPKIFSIWLAKNALIMAPRSINIEGEKWEILTEISEGKDEDGYPIDPYGVIISACTPTAKIIEQKKNNVNESIKTITIGEIVIDQIGNGVQVVGYGFDLADLMIDILKKIFMVYHGKVHFNKVDGMNGIFIGKDAHDNLSNNFEEKIIEPKQKGRYRLTEDDINYRKNKVKKANQMKKDDITRKWKDIARELEIPDRTLRGWRHDPTLQ